MGSTYTVRNWDVYKNGHSYADKARALKKSDIDKWYCKYIDGNYSDSLSIPKLPQTTENKLISTLNNGMFYWIGEPFHSNSWGSMYCFSPMSGGFGGRSECACGVRVVVDLKSQTRFGEIPEKKMDDSYEYNVWSIIG